MDTANDRAGRITTRRDFLKVSAAAGAAVVLSPAFAGAQRTAGRPVKLSVWHTEPNPATFKAMQEIIADFQKATPRITVEQQALGWADMENKLLAALAAGSPPDIAQPIQYVTPTLYAKGLLRPIDEIVAAVGKEDIFPRVRDVGTLFDGHYYGITHAWGADMWIYRKDWADAKGLKEPTTWNEMHEWTKALTEPPARYGISLAGSPGFFVNEDVYMFVGQNGGRVWNDHGLPTLTEEPVVQMLEHYKALAPSMAAGWVSHSYVDTLANLATGKTACISTWGRTIGYLEQYAPTIADPEHFAAIKYKPVGPSAKGPASQKMFTQLDGEHWVIFKDSKAPAEAAEFIKFFFKRENYLRYCNSVPLHLLPIKRSYFRDPEYLNHPVRKKWKVWLDTQMEYLDKGFTMPLMMINASDGKIPWLLEVANSGIYADMVFDVVTKATAPKEAATRGESRVNKLIAEVAPRRR
jgi:multiple sugar transport system substrate-binding protein